MEKTFPDLFKASLVFTQLPAVLQALPVTLALTLIAMAAGLVIGTVAALVKIRQVPVLRQITAVYVSLTRGTPVIVQLYLSYFGIPLVLRYINFLYGTSFSVNNIPPFVFAFVALALNQGAYCSETIRAALLSVDRGQIEAAQSLGMTRLQVLRRVLAPQAFLVALPPLGNALIGLLKETSLAFVCSVVDITARAKILAGSNLRFFESYCSAAIIYWVITFIIERLLRVCEARLSVPDAPKENYA